MSNFFTNALHSVSQGLLVPTVVCLLLLICASVFLIGTFIAEIIRDRAHMKLSMEKLMNNLDKADIDQIDSVLNESNLLNRQKQALIKIFNNKHLQQESLVAFARKVLAKEKSHYATITGISDMGAKIGPMLGLMGTLIPLGPGIIALSTGETETLSNALLVAFDTTVAGLVSAVVCMIISKIRKKWYKQYMIDLQTAATSILERIDGVSASKSAPEDKPAYSSASAYGSRK